MTGFVQRTTCGMRVRLKNAREGAAPSRDGPAPSHQAACCSSLASRRGASAMSASRAVCVHSRLSSRDGVGCTHQRPLHVPNGGVGGDAGDDLTQVLGDRRGDALHDGDAVRSACWR